MLTRSTTRPPFLLVCKLQLEAPGVEYVAKPQTKGGRNFARPRFVSFLVGQLDAYVALWLIFLGVWILAAASTKRSVRRDSSISRFVTARACSKPASIRSRITFRSSSAPAPRFTASFSPDHASCGNCSRSGIIRLNDASSSILQRI